jgi:hypothetical protein
MRNVKELGWLLVSTLSAYAQSGAFVEGDVRNRATGTGIAGAGITFFTKEAARYQVFTDATGTFHIADMEPGQYQALIEKSGFVVLPESSFQVERGGAPIELQYQMQFGVLPPATLSGRVLDSQGQPAASARVILIRGPELSFTTISDGDGHFAFVQVDPGAYTLLAEPSSILPAQSEGPRTEDVATYFPSSIEAGGAQRIEVRGNATVDGFQLQTAPVFRVKGTVTDSYGKIASHASVRIAPMTRQPAHVISSLGVAFAAVGEGPGPGPETSRTMTDADGGFEFPSVPSGQWNIAAEGADGAQAGSAALTVVDADVNDFRVRVTDPFPLAGSAKWTIRCVSAALACGQKPAEGAAIPVWFRSADGMASALRLGIVQPDGTFRVDNVQRGNYLIQILAPLLDGHILAGAGVNWRMGTHGGSASQAMDLDRGDPLDVTFAIGLSEGGSVILDADHPVDRTAANITAALSGSVHGIVENGGGSAVVLLPDSFAEGARGALAFCRADGTFDALDLPAGSYRIAAFPGVDMEGLRDPDLFARLLATEKKVRVQLGTTAQVQLELSPWP